MDMRDDDGVDRRRINAGGGQALRQMAGQRADAAAVAGVNKHKLVAGIDQPGVERRRRGVSGDEPGVHQFADAGRIPGEELGRERPGAVVEDGDLESADLHAVNAGGLRAVKRRLRCGRQGRERGRADCGKSERTTSECHLSPP
jgi:hypothetical protein